MSNAEKFAREAIEWADVAYPGYSQSLNSTKASAHTGMLKGYAAAKQADAQRIERLEKALNRIASWDEGPVVGPHFDEPASAEIARAALENKQ